MATAALWQLRLLGAFELSDGQQRLHKLGTRAAMALLARLCLQPSADHPREALVDLLWPGVAAEAGRQRLRQTLSTLKQVLEPATHAGFSVIDADRQRIRLVAGTVQCDVLAFEQAFRRGDHDSAHALYTGELLPGFFDEWISDERLRLEGLFDRLRLPALVTPTALPAAQAQPPAATALPSSLTTGPTTGPATSPHLATLPAYLTRLIGAGQQAARLQQDVAAHRLVTLLGPGGTGKTRLSVEVAQALAAGGLFERVVFVPLAACRTRQQLLDQLLLALHLAEGKAGALATVVQALNGRRALLVLDNFEQVVDEGAEAAGELAQQLPLLHLLVTSRRALALPGEREVVAAPLALPGADASLADAVRNPAVALFVDRARGARAEFHLHEGNRAAVLDLVQLLDGMPLAIELAAARVRSMAPAEMVATLQQARAGKASALDLLARAPQRGRQDTRHHSMQDTIAWSWQLLDDELRHLLAALTVFQAGFTAASAAAVCTTDAGAPRSVGTMALLLDALLSHSLLRAQASGRRPDQRLGGGTSNDADGDARQDAADDASQPLRFSLYEPIREFAQRSLPAAAAAALRRRHRAWATAWGLAMPATPPLAALRTELPNLVAALTSAVADGEPQAALDLALALRPAIDHAELPSAGLDALEAALEGCDDAAKRNAGRLLLGQSWFRQGRIDDGRRLIAQALHDAPATQPGVRVRALLAAAQAAPYTNDRMPQSIAWLDEALQLAQTQGDADVLASAASLRGAYARMVENDLERSEALQQQALALWQQQGDQLAVLRARQRMAQVALRAGRYASACAQMDPVISAARSLQSWGGLAEALHARAAAHRMQQHWAQASADVREALQLHWLALDSYNTQRTLWTVIFVVARARPAAAQQLSAFASAFWQQHYGQLSHHHHTAMRYARRVAQLKLGVAASAAAFAAGSGLTVAAAVALALEGAGG